MEIGEAVIGVNVDVTDIMAVEKARDATLKAFGKIDILVNNAGITGKNGPVWETDLADWQRVMRINLEGPFICCKTNVPTMLAQKYGRIVNSGAGGGGGGGPGAARGAAAGAGRGARAGARGGGRAGRGI